MKKTIIVALTLIGLCGAAAQGFVNLNFENANLSGYGPGLVPTADAIPGWSAFEGTNQLYSIEYNNYLASYPVVLNGGSNSFVLSANFSLTFGPVSLGYVSSISQTGLVPSGTESLFFDATSSAILVSLGGQNLSCAAVSANTNSYGLNYYVYAADVSVFAGQVETLTFSGFGTLGDIQFSSQLIPEPSPLWLLFLGSGVLLYVRNRKQCSAAQRRF